MKADALTSALRLSVRLLESRGLGIRRSKGPGIRGLALFPTASPSNHRNGRAAHVAPAAQQTTHPTAQNATALWAVG